MMSVVLSLLVATIFGLVFLYADVESDRFDEDEGDEKNY